MSRVVIVGEKPLLPELVVELKEEFGATRLPSKPDEREAWFAHEAADVEVAVTAANVGVSAELMAQLPALKLVAVYGVGYDATDVAAATERGIVVTNTPDVLNDCVADLAIGLMIDVMRGLSEADRFARAGRWGVAGGFPLRRRVTGAKVGILGLGRIGLEIAARCEGFRCEIRYHNRAERGDVAYGYEPDVLGLAQWADVLVVATPGGAGTEALVDAEVLAALGAQGYLVNIARGSVVDEDALVEALASGKLAGAGLDVYAHEPRIPAELQTLDNVVLAPHIASGTVETRRAMADGVLANIRSWFDDGHALTPVN